MVAIIKTKKKAYTKYCRVFGINLNEILSMDRVEFSRRFGSKFKYMSISKFKKTIDQICVAFENGKETLQDYK